MTLYRLATTPADYRKCHKIIKPLAWKLSYPTVMAERDGDLLGFLSTLRHPKRVVAGPIHAPNGIVMLRLAEAYENFLWTAGVRVYLVPAQDPRHAGMLDRLGYERTAETGGVAWFRKTLRAA